MSATATTTAWLVSAMLTWSPPGRTLYAPDIETQDEAHDRFEQIATAALHTSFDKSETPIFGGKYGRTRTALLLLSAAWWESGFAKHVDLGPCRPGECDGGASACMMQIKVGAGSTVEGWSKAELFEDREKCFRAGLHKIRKSYHACRSFEPLDRLGGYTHGYCVKDNKKSHERIGKAIDWFLAHKPPLEDEPVLLESGSVAWASVRTTL